MFKLKQWWQRLPYMVPWKIQLTSTLTLMKKPTSSSIKASTSWINNRTIIPHLMLSNTYFTLGPMKRSPVPAIFSTHGVHLSSNKANAWCIAGHSISTGYSGEGPKGSKVTFTEGFRCGKCLYLMWQRGVKSLTSIANYNSNGQVQLYVYKCFYFPRWRFTGSL